MEKAVVETSSIRQDTMTLGIYIFLIKFKRFFPLIGVIFGIENKKKKGMY